MTTKFLATALAVTIGLLFTVSTAQAARPLDVDCDVLEAAVIDADTILDAIPVVFNSVGDLFAQANLDDAVFKQLRDLILFTSGGQILFDSASQAISSVARCGLLPLLNTEIED